MPKVKPIPSWTRHLVCSFIDRKLDAPWTPGKSLWYNDAMIAHRTLQTFDRLLAPLGQRFSPELAQALMDLQADEQLQNLMDDLADKCTAGTLTGEEREEYESLISASALISALKARARRQLDGQ